MRFLLSYRHETAFSLFEIETNIDRAPGAGIAHRFGDRVDRRRTEFEREPSPFLEARLRFLHKADRQFGARDAPDERQARFEFAHRTVEPRVFLFGDVRGIRDNRVKALLFGKIVGNRGEEVALKEGHARAKAERFDVAPRRFQRVCADIESDEGRRGNILRQRGGDAAASDPDVADLQSL